MRIHRRFTAPSLAILIALVACSGNAARTNLVPQSSDTQKRAVTKIDWPTWGFNTQRWSSNDAETTLSPTSITGLKLLWTHAMPAKLILTQPIVASNVQIANGRTIQIIYVGDEKGNFHAVSADTGKTVWSRVLGLTSTPCGTGSAGVTSTPVLDRSTNRIYVLDGLAKLWAFDLATGALSPGFSPVTLYTGTNANDTTWSALLLSPDASTIYYPTSSHSDTENCGIFFGTVNSISTLTQTITTYQVVQNPSTYYGAGVWSWGGESIDPDTGNIYASVGNSWGSIGETGANSDSVLELTPSMSFVADEQPEMNLSHDHDISTSPVVYDNQGECLAVERKNGDFFTIERESLANLQYGTKLSFGNHSAPLASAAYDSKTQALYLALVAGLTKLSVGPNCTASQVWQTPINEHTERAVVPAVANGVVYVAGSATAGGTNNVLYAIDAVTGAVLWTSGTTITGEIVAEPTVVNGRVYVSAWDGHLYAFGL